MRQLFRDKCWQNTRVNLENLDIRIEVYILEGGQSCTILKNEVKKDIKSHRSVVVLWRAVQSDSLRNLGLRFVFQFLQTFLFRHCNFFSHCCIGLPYYDDTVVFEDFSNNVGPITGGLVFQAIENFNWIHEHVELVLIIQTPRKQLISNELIEDQIRNPLLKLKQSSTLDKLNSK